MADMACLLSNLKGKVWTNSVFDKVDEKTWIKAIECASCVIQR